MAAKKKRPAAAPKEVVNFLLDTVPPPGSRNIVEDNKKLAEAIEYFLDLKRDGDPRAHVSLRWFYLNKLRDSLGGPKTIDTVHKFVREILHRDPSTGEEL